jgi:hypothetical protein
MLTRRDVLQKCVALGSVVITSPESPESMLAAFQDHEKGMRKPLRRIRSDHSISDSRRSTRCCVLLTIWHAAHPLGTSLRHA